ncbi:MAG: diiron oxygenase [Pseudomonadota bacterium]|nr:diiron oxygenase [Pseudomonadota bacterium]
MKRLSAEQINRLAADPRHTSAMQGPFVIDRSLPFVPEHHTQLYYTPAYATLSDAQRLRYNQLFALRINEYIMLLESDLIDALLPSLLRDARVRGDAALSAAVRTMIDEERRHHAGFAAFNRACRPDLYPPGHDRCFARMPAAQRWAFGALALLSSRWRFGLWYLMAMEESSKSLAREMLTRPHTETLGTLDPAYVALHRQHLKDETRHLHIDALLIERCLQGHWPRVNTWLFARLMAGALHVSPHGSGARVVRQLVRDCPELAPREPALIQSLLELRRHRAFRHGLFNRRIMPESFALFDQTPPLAAWLARTMPHDAQA